MFCKKHAFFVFLVKKYPLKFTKICPFREACSGILWATGDGGEQGRPHVKHVFI